MIDLYRLPLGARLDTDELHDALAAVHISIRSYRANGCTHHQFRDIHTGTALHVVESPAGEPRRLTEVVGDTALWLTVRSAAVAIATAAPAA